MGSDGKPSAAIWFDDSAVDRARSELGNVLRTRQDAEQRIAAIRTRVRLQRIAERLNNDWRPNWRDTAEAKWTVVYDHERKALAPSWSDYEDLDCVYFQSSEAAQQAIAELGNDLHGLLDYGPTKRREVIKDCLEEIRKPRFSLLTGITKRWRQPLNP